MLGLSFLTLFVSLILGVWTRSLEIEAIVERTALTSAFISIVSLILFLILISSYCPEIL